MNHPSSVPHALFRKPIARRPALALAAAAGASAASLALPRRALAYVAPGSLLTSYDTWAAGPGHIRPVEYAYLCSFCNDVAAVAPDRDALTEGFIRKVKEGFPADHPLLSGSTVAGVIGGSNNSMEAVVIRYSSSAIVVFAGTNTRSGLWDMLTDFGLIADGLPGVQAIAIPKRGIDAAFSTTQVEMARDLVKAVLDQGHEHVFVTGHSLGGHLAVECAIHDQRVCECCAFDPPGRGDAARLELFHDDWLDAITVYRARWSFVSSTFGSQVGREYVLDVAPNSAGEENTPVLQVALKNHGITQIADALGGMRELRSMGWEHPPVSTEQTSEPPEDGPDFATVEFGSYPQGENGEVAPIEWYVLAEEDGWQLLLSRYVLDYRAYVEEPTYREGLSWETCELRAWLNGEFLESAFNADERSAILEVELQNLNSSTRDRVWLLSAGEAMGYFGVERNWDQLRDEFGWGPWEMDPESVFAEEPGYRDMVAEPTAYALSLGISLPSLADDPLVQRSANWWLRSCDLADAFYYCVIMTHGNVGPTLSPSGVRPAIWVSL